jgi:hypothetical protein
MQSHAFEREMIRHERDPERSRIRAERDAERQQKQESKDAQIDQELEAAVSSFRSETHGIRWAQIIAGAIGIGGVALLYAQALDNWPIPLVAILAGVAGIVTGHVFATTQAKQQREAFRNKAAHDVHDGLQNALEALAREQEVLTRAALQNARAAYEAETETKRAAFEAEEDERLRELRELMDGDTSRMREALEAVLPLDLPVPCGMTFDVQSSRVVSIEVDVPEPGALPTTEAKLLASGKVAYKEKSEKRLREQYVRLVAGVGVRHASETMLNLPTCERVELRACRTALDSSIGRPTRRVILEVRFDYPTLAPMTMDDLDPVLALQHFDHRINVDRNRQLQPLDDRGV